MRLVIQVSALVLFRQRRTRSGKGYIKHLQDHFTVLLHADGDAADRNTMCKVNGAIQVDDPLDIGVRDKLSRILRSG